MYCIYKLLNYTQNRYDHARAVSHVFTTLGNGISMDSRGWIDYGTGDSYVITEYPEPKAFDFLYPWSETTKVFEKYAGCRDKGFKEAVEYFLACLELTGEIYTGDGERKQRTDLKWKENAESIKETLLNSPTIEDRYTINDLDKFLEDIKNEENSLANIHNSDGSGAKDSLRQIYFFDVQWSDCPKSVENEVRELWSNQELYNDVCIYKAELNEELFEQYPMIYFWIKSKGLENGTDFLIHWWW